MTTIAAGTSATVTLAQGNTLKTTGTGIAVLGPGPQANMQIGLQGGNTLGPYAQDQVIYLTATTQVDYVIPELVVLSPFPRVVTDVFGNTTALAGQAGSVLAQLPYGHPPALTWCNGQNPGQDIPLGIDFFGQWFAKKPTIFYDPRQAGTSRNLGTITDPYTTQAQLQSVISGDMSGQVLGIARGSTTRVAGTSGLTLTVNGSTGNPFTICPYGDGALPIITAGVVTTGWVQHAGSIYKVTGLAQSCDVWQNDQRLQRVASLAAVTGPGMSFYSGGTMYVWPIGSIDPNTATMEITGSDFALNVIYADVTATGYINVVGMDCRKARNISLRGNPFPGAVNITSIANVVFAGCRGGQAGCDGVGNASDGILMYGSDTVSATGCMIVGCEGYDSLNNAFEVGGMDGLVVTGNYGHDVGGNTILEAWFNCKNMRVSRNFGARSGLGPTRLTTSYHKGGIWATTYTNAAGTGKSHAAFANNWFDFNIVAETVGQAIEIVGGTSNKVRHNLAYNSSTTSTNRMFNFFANCAVAGSCDVEYSNNVAVVSGTGSSLAVDMLQGACTTTDAGAFAVTATVTGDKNLYLSFVGSAGLRCRTPSGVTSTGASNLAVYQAAAVPADAGAIAYYVGTPAGYAVGNYVTPAYRKGSLAPAGLTGLAFTRYKDGFPYDATAPVVGPYGS